VRTFAAVPNFALQHPACYRRLMTESAPSPEALVSELVDLLSVQPAGEDLYLGIRKKEGRGRVFGGQVVAQALAAAQATVSPDRPAHSLHAYFLRGGSEDHEIAYKVERDFDGGSLSNRRIVALQQERPIFNMAVSFHKRADGLSHQNAMPDAPQPEALASEAELRARFAEEIPATHRAHFLRERPFEHRPCVPRDYAGGDQRFPAEQNIWFRLRGAIGDDPGLHRAMIAYASDSWLLGTCMIPHGVRWETPGFFSTSLDHAIWFHDEARADEWLLYACDSPWAGRERGFNRGSVYARDGRLIATVAQEGLVRYRPG
jgi:acyl-CoA thioesterase II